jgi:hypothetical protein
METPQSKNPLEFWVAYMPAPDNKRHYLSDGSGHLRIFKTSTSINEYLKSVLKPAELEQVVVHSVEGKIVVPETDIVSETPALSYSAPVISTLAAPTMPTAKELLDNIEKRRNGRGAHGRRDN